MLRGVSYNDAFFQLALDKADEEDKKLATNLERQLLFSIRPTLLDNSGPVRVWRLCICTVCDTSPIDTL